MTATPTEWIAAAAFALAIVHTFAAKYIERLSHRPSPHAKVWHLLGEVEAVFGVWALVLFLCTMALQGNDRAVRYLDTRNYTEPLFVFVIMVVAATRPILQTATAAVDGLSRLLPFKGMIGFCAIVLSFVPLLGSFITEPAAMTLAALMISDRLFSRHLPEGFKYAVLGVLFVNVSIGGTLTHFAAPPVLMVASAWGWDMAFMLGTFGWKALIAVFANAALVIWLHRKKLAGLAPERAALGPGAAIDPHPPAPAWLVAIHLLFLALVVFYAHHPAVFMGLFIFFLGVAYAYKKYQSPLILKEALLVGFFLAGLVVLGGMQQWWLQPVLLGMNHDAVFFGATALTAFTDNAALTYLGSLVQGLSPRFQYALVAGAVAGGGLTIIANAPNPAGVSIVSKHFEDGSVSPLGLLKGAAIPTLVAMAAFWLL